MLSSFVSVGETGQVALRSPINRQGILLKPKFLPLSSGGTGPIANTLSLRHELHSEKVITPTATWPPKQDPQSERAGCLSEEPACFTQEVKSREVDKKDDLPKEVQLESESPPALAREDEDLGRKDDGQKQTLEVITEIPEDDKTALGNCQQEVEGSSPVSIVN